MEELMCQLAKENVTLKCFDIPECYLEGKDQKTVTALKNILLEKYACQTIGVK